MDIFQSTGNGLLTIGKWEQFTPKLKVGFTTRQGGSSQGYYSSNNLGLHVSDNYEHVMANRRNFVESLEMPLDNWVSGEQVHSNLVYNVQSDDRGKGAKAVESSIRGMDGLITKEKDILITAFFADCVPLFFFDPKTNYIGLAHAGWKGTVKGIAGEMTKQFVNHGSNLNDLLVVIGPCISQEHYEVDEYVKDQIPLEYREKVLTSLGDRHYLLDLKRLNVENLVHSGIFHSNIDITNYCTYRDKNLFFSHRRDEGKTGRMLGFIGFSS